jgi:hypothetical protein
MSGQRVDLEVFRASLDCGVLLNLTHWRALVDEVEAARAFRDEIHSALRPGRWRGFDGPDGVSKDEVIADVTAALERFDQHTATQDPGS